MFIILGADGKEYGPVTTDQVKAWISDGRANHDTQVKRESETLWKRIGDLAEFAGTISLPPPVIAPTGPIDPRVYAETIIARNAPLDITGCLSRSWKLVTGDFWSIVGTTALALIILAVLSIIPLLGALANLVISGPIAGGLFFFLLKKIRSETATTSDIFAGFNLAFGALFLGALVVAIVTGLGALLLILPGIYLAVAYQFVSMLIIDKKLDFWSAMEVSRRVISAQWFRLLGLVLLSGLVILAGFIALGIGVFVAIPVVYGALAYAYEDLVNPPAKP